MNKHFLYLIFFLGLSCSGNLSNKEGTKDDVLLAEVKDKNLYLSEVSPFNFKGLSEEDSVSFLKSYTTNWIKNEILVLKASDKISNMKEIETEIDKYRKDLIKAAYQKKALESIEIELTEDDLVSYYSKHKDYFVFEEDYYEIKYIVLPRNTSNLQQIRKSIIDKAPSNFIENYCTTNKDKCHLKKSNFKKLTYLTESLKMPKNIIRKDNLYMFHYMDADNVLIYRIISIKRKGETAPLEIVRSEVTKMCTHNKKQEYLLEIEEKSYQKAKNDKVFENYIN